MSEYKKFRRGKYKIICRTDFIEKLEEFFSAPAEFIRKNTIRTYMVAPNLVADIKLASGDKLTVKSFGWRSKLHFFMSPFRGTKASRSFKVAMRLSKHGVLTPAPVCLLERRFLGFVVENIYITESIDNYITVREYLQKQPDGYRKSHGILKELAQYVRKIHEAGIWHRDLHLTNFLMIKNETAPALFYLVDLNRARLFHKLPFFLRVFDVGKMDFHEFRADFVDFYLQDVKRRVFWEMVFYIYVILRRMRRKFLHP